MSPPSGRWIASVVAIAVAPRPSLPAGTPSLFTAWSSEQREQQRIALLAEHGYGADGGGCLQPEDEPQTRAAVN